MIAFAKFVGIILFKHKKKQNTICGKYIGFDNKKRSEIAATLSRVRRNVDGVRGT